MDQDQKVNKILKDSMKTLEESKQEKEGFFKRWKNGILDMSIEQQLKGKMIGIIGGIVGLILALITMIVRKQWGFSIFVFFIIWIQFITYIGMRKQYLQTKEMMEGLETQELGNKISKSMKELI